MIEIIPNWHPIFVNFTVALFVVSMLLHIVALSAPNAPWRSACLAAAHWNLALGAVFALITVGTGLNAYADDHGSPDAAPAQEPAPNSPAGHGHGAHDHGGQAVDAPRDGPIFALNSFHEALNSGDEQTVIAALSPDVLIFESGGAERSRAEYASHHMKSDMAFLAQMGHDQISQAAFEQGDTAWIVTESRIYGRYKEKDIDIISTETAVLERGEDGWKIVHLHWSSR